MVRTPSSKAACASGLVFGSATGAIGLTGAEPGAGALCAQPASASNSSGAIRIALTELGFAERSRRGRAREPSQGSRILLVTADLLDAVQGDARFTGTGRQPELGLLRVLVLRQPRQRLPDGLRVLVVDADLQRARVARLVGVDGLVFDHDDDLLQLVAVHLLLVFLEIARHGRVAHGLGVRLVPLADAQQRRRGPL